VFHTLAGTGSLTAELGGYLVITMPLVVLFGIVLGHRLRGRRLSIVQAQ
jgi:hypothetical protein